MGNTSVNGVGNLIGNLNASAQLQMVNKISNAVSNDTSSTSPSFESYLSAGAGQNSMAMRDTVNNLGTSKAEKNPSVDQKDNSDRIAGEDKHDARKTSGTDNKQDKVADSRKKDDSVKDATQEEMSEEDIEKAGEALGSAVAELLTQVEDILQITPEEAEELLDQMGMSAEDLLNKENLSAFALQAMGAEDSLALLTDESKYEQFQNISDVLAELLGKESDFKGLTPEELRALLDKMKEGEEDGAGSITDAGSIEDAAMVKSDAAVIGEKQNTKENGGDFDEQAQNGAENFIQNNEVKNPEVPITNSSSMTETANAQQIADQIMDYIKTNVKGDTQTLEMQLHPASLGNIQISLTNKGGDITASFVAQNEQVKAALEIQMVQLQQRFEEQGIKVSAIEVSVGTHGFEQNLDQQGRQDEGQESQKPRRVRRLQLSPGMDIPEALDEEDQLAAEMMAANGGTMDVQA